MVAATSNTPPSSSSESLDLAEIGKAWTPPQEIDTTPEVADVIAEMPWWAARGLLYIITGFVIVALVWAHFSMVDVTIEARGALVPEGYVRPVQAAGSGVVQQVFVREGETVGRGQPLLQIDAAELRTRLGKLREELTTSEMQLRRLRAMGPFADVLEQENRLARLGSEIAGVESALRQTTVTAPVDGILTTLDVRSVGAVTQAGQTIATIAPGDAPLVVAAQVPNKDIAFIERGLPVKLKFDSFPHQDYGTVNGTVTYVSPDATVDATLGSFYKVLIAPQQTGIVAKGKSVPLRPGLALSAEIITERKSILSMILEPFNKLRGEAG